MRYSRKQITEAIAYWERELQRIDENKITDFFGKLFKTKAWKKQQAELEQAKREASWKEFLKKHPLAKVEQQLNRVTTYRCLDGEVCYFNPPYKAKFGTIDFENEGFPVDAAIQWDFKDASHPADDSTKGDFLVVAHRPEDMRDAEDLTDIRGHSKVWTAVERAGLTVDELEVMPLAGYKTTSVIYYKNSGIFSPDNLSELTSRLQT